jgi:predicted RNA-binding Zn-ribbon protein involved in translation (DUF1610 family)
MNFLQLRSYDSYITAHLHLQQLEAEGIRAYLQDENTVTINPALSAAIGGIKLMVYDSQFSRAVEIINAIEDAYRQSLPCPRCGALNIHSVTDTKKAVNWFSAIISSLLSNYAVPVKTIYRCFTCGYEMDQLPEQ